MKLRSLALAGAMMFACALPVAAQTSATLSVKDATSTTRNLCETADGSGNLTPCLQAGAATAAAQALLLNAAQPPGNIATNQGSVTTTATVLVAARAGRRTVTVEKTGTTPVYLGASGVTSSTGFPLRGVAGTSITGALYAVTASSTAAVGTSCRLTIDVSNLSAPLPQIWYRIDGQAWLQATIAASVLLTMPQATSTALLHSLEVVVKSTTETQNRWNSPSATAVALTGIVLDGAAGAQAPGGSPTNVLFYGDSITEGVRTLGRSQTNDTDRNDARNGWPIVWASSWAPSSGSSASAAPA